MKRATYFWAFLALTLGGYFTLLAAKDTPCNQKGEALLTISCRGVVFSVAWYFVNRGSKFWQENWENHVDLLEDEVNVPLYKTVLSDANLSFWKVSDPYPFSVSKLNQTLSFFVVLLFVLLMIKTLCDYRPHGLSKIMVLILTIASVITLCGMGQTNRSKKRSKKSLTSDDYREAFGLPSGSAERVGGAKSVHDDRQTAQTLEPGKKRS